MLVSDLIDQLRDKGNLRKAALIWLAYVFLTLLAIYFTESTNIDANSAARLDGTMISSGLSVSDILSQWGTFGDFAFMFVATAVVIVISLCLGKISTFEPHLGWRRLIIAAQVMFFLWGLITAGNDKVGGLFYNMMINGLPSALFHETAGLILIAVLLWIKGGFTAKKSM